MGFDGSTTNAQIGCYYFIELAGAHQLQHFAFASGKGFKTSRNAIRIPQPAAVPRIFFERAADAIDQVLIVKRFLQKVEAPCLIASTAIGMSP